MSFLHGKIACLREISSAHELLPSLKVRGPECDSMEGRVWESLGGGWHCLHGEYCDGGVSVEWHDFTCAERIGWGRSFHPDTLELCLNVSGEAHLEWEGGKAAFGPHTAGLYFCSRGEPRAWRLPGEPHQFLTVEFAREFLARHLRKHEAGLHPAVRRALQKRPGPAEVSPVRMIPHRLRKAVELLREPPVARGARALWYEAKAIELLSEFSFVTGEMPAAANTRQREVNRARIEQVMAILQARLCEPPPLEQLGRETGCSPYYLSRIFSRETGMTIPQYLRQTRMERAAELLKSGKYNVTEAALEVGYSSLSHFSTAFCQTMGCCPGLYPLSKPPA